MPTETEPESTALVLEVARGDGLELLTNKLDVMLRAADALRKSGLCGDASTEQVLARVLMGRELGMGPIASIRSIHVVKGRPTLDAAAQLARAIRAGVSIEWKATDAKIATLVLKRGGQSFTSTWTIEMAQSAGLTRKDGPWITMPWTMLRARAITSGIRAFCPDVLDTGGTLYSPDELEDIGRVEVKVAAPAWTPGEHHATFAAVSKQYAMDVGDYSKLADWLESGDPAAGRLRKGIADRVGDPSLEQPWRPSWVPPRAREALVTFVNGKNGAKAREACAAWHAKAGDIDVEFEPVEGTEPDAKPKRKTAPKDAPKSDVPKAEPLTLTDAERDEMIEEITALEQGVGEEAWKAERAKLSLDVNAKVTPLVKHATNLSRRYLEALGDVMSATKAPTA